MVSLKEIIVKFLEERGGEAKVSEIVEYAVKRGYSIGHIHNTLRELRLRGLLEKDGRVYRLSGKSSEVSSEVIK